MSKLEIGKQYLVKCGKRVKVLYAKFDTINVKELRFSAVVVGDEKATVEYTPRGEATGAVNDDMLIVDMVDVPPGETLPEPPARDDDPVHPQEDDIGVAPAPDIVRSIEDQEEVFHDKLVQAVLDGKTIQIKRAGNSEWEDMRNRAFAIRMLMQPGDHGNLFRLKPTPIKSYLAIYKEGRMGAGYSTLESIPDAGWGVVTALELDIDPGTMRVVGFKNHAARESAKKE